MQPGHEPLKVSFGRCHVAPDESAVGLQGGLPDAPIRGPVKAARKAPLSANRIQQLRVGRPRRCLRLPFESPVPTESSAAVNIEPPFAGVGRKSAASLALNYLGQGALLISDATALGNPFFRLFPSSWLIPAVVLAALASVIASQATISGAYSLTKQAIQLGLLPRMQIFSHLGE